MKVFQESVQVVKLIIWLVAIQRMVVECFGARGNSVEEYNSIDKDETLSSSHSGFHYVRNRKVNDEESQKEV